MYSDMKSTVLKTTGEIFKSLHTLDIKRCFQGFYLLLLEWTVRGLPKSNARVRFIKVNKHHLPRDCLSVLLSEGSMLSTRLYYTLKIVEGLKIIIVGKTLDD